MVKGKWKHLLSIIVLILFPTAVARLFVARVRRTPNTSSPSSFLFFLKSLLPRQTPRRIHMTTAKAVVAPPGPSMQGTLFTYHRDGK